MRLWVLLWKYAPCLSLHASVFLSDRVRRCASVYCTGEIGQVGKSTYLHGFTAAVGILREQLEANES